MYTTKTTFMFINTHTHTPCSKKKKNLPQIPIKNKNKIKKTATKKGASLHMQSTCDEANIYYSYDKS